MSCDGDSVSVTAATQPSLEDVVLGLVPGIPKVHLHNKVLAYETGEDFIKPFRQAANGELGPFVFVFEGSIPNENINGEGFWSSFGNDLNTGDPLKVTQWIDWLAPKALAVVAIGTCATYGGIHAMAGNPTAAWAWLITWAGTGAPALAFPSLTCRAARSSPITSWRPCYGSFTRLRCGTHDSPG